MRRNNLLIIVSITLLFVLYAKAEAIVEVYDKLYSFTEDKSGKKILSNTSE